MRNIPAAFLLALVGVCASVWAADDSPQPNAAEHAIKESQITLPGSKPFHLTAKTFESTDRDNDSHNATIEEDWVSPEKWRRIVKTADFSEILIVNGDKKGETLTGNYYPNWLRQFVNGIFDPGAPLEGVDFTKSHEVSKSARLMNGTITSMEVCPRFTFLVGTPPATNKIFSSYCFEDGLLKSVLTPGYEISYGGYKKFGDKKVARKLGEYIESGTELEADITELRELPGPPNEPLFAISQTNVPLRTVVVSESVARNLLVSAPEIRWPTLTSGRNPGTLSIYIAIDREGQVRETIGLNSDNPIMTAAAREQVMNWKFKPAANNGERVQVESILTFGYQAKIVSSP